MVVRGKYCCCLDGSRLTATNSESEKRNNTHGAKKMNAAVVEVFGKPLVVREWDIPTPGAGEIVVKTEACGVCHTDLHAADGDWPVKPTLPFIPGHEAIGLVFASRGRRNHC